MNPAALRELLDTPRETDEAGLNQVASLMFYKKMSEPAARLAVNITPEGHGAFPYRLETVARLAATLLKNGDFKQAAVDAIDLLDACRSELSRITEEAASQVLSEREAAGISSAVDLPLTELHLREFAKIRDSRLPGPLTYDGLVKYVTGNDRARQANDLFRNFHKDGIRRGKAAEAAGLRSFDENYLNDDGAATERRKRFDARYAATPNTTDAEIDALFSRPDTVFQGWRAHLMREKYQQWWVKQKASIASRKGQLGGRGKRGTKSK